MKWMNAIMRPGTILEVVDDKGSIKASAPGLFSAEDQDKLPPIHPWPTTGSNNFSTPNIGEEVWVVNFTDNPEELFWMRKDDFSKNNGDRNKTGGQVGGKNIQQQKNVEVLFSRESGPGWSTIMFSDDSGMLLQNNNTIIQLNPSGNVLITNGQPNGTIEISDNGISLGTKGGSEHPAAHGDSVAELFDKVIGTLKTISVAAKGSPYTMAIAEAIDRDVPKYENDSQYINSDYVTLN